MSGTERGGNILLVDDTVANLKLLAGMLREDGHNPRPVSSGAMALDAAAADPPELILLDITMPGMDGFEVCRRLKANPVLAQVPVIFISALTEIAEKVRGFQVGGVDYVTKPFQGEEVRARVRTHLMLHRLQRDLEQRYQELQRLQDLRDNLTNMIVHDLRGPLTSVMGYLDLLQTESATFPGDAPAYVGEAYQGAENMAEMINSLLDVTRLEAGEMPIDALPCDLSDVATEAVRSLRGLAVNRQLTQEPAPGPMSVSCDRALVRRVIANLVGNALKFTPASGSVSVRMRETPGCVRLEVTDTGPGIAPGELGRVFDKFGQGAAGRAKKQSSSGLGLAFCKLAVGAHGGRIGVISELGHGSTFWLELPSTS